MEYFRQLPTITFDDFFLLALNVKAFNSSTGRRYKVERIEKTVMHFVRKDANLEQDWSFDLKDVHEAYMSLNDFKTASFKKYVPRRHSPARGLLLHLEMLK